MKTEYITLYSSNEEQAALGEFEDAFYNSLRRYSLRHLPFVEEVSQEKILEALQKSLQVCQLAGINSKQHFKQIYIYDDNIKTIHIDWKMSKRAVNLMATQIATLNEKTARWLWELSEY
ncbi:hypothetical protein [Emticicia sp. SJ17W-69]|uniref:hypothetical protein n=1 Tax=Emticicia sp. SJ17W-69 TaxID=3421657 RepID=UPI003EBF01B2